MQKFWEDVKSYSTLFKGLFIKRSPLCNREKTHYVRLQLVQSETAETFKLKF